MNIQILECASIFHYSQMIKDIFGLQAAGKPRVNAMHIMLHSVSTKKKKKNTP